MPGNSLLLKPVKLPFSVLSISLECARLRLKWLSTENLTLFVNEVGDFGALTVTAEAGILKTFNELIKREQHGTSK